MTGAVMEIVITVTVTGIVEENENERESVIVIGIATGKGTAIVTEIGMVIAEMVKGAIGIERDGQKEMRVRSQGLTKTALQFLIPPNVRKADGTIEVYQKEAVNCS